MENEHPWIESTSDFILKPNMTFVHASILEMIRMKLELELKMDSVLQKMEQSCFQIIVERLSRYSIPLVIR